MSPKSRERRSLTRRQSFEVGDQVLVMTPSITGKLDDLWTGPYTIAEKMNEVTYKVHTPDRKKKSRLFHINGIKAWHNEPVAILSVKFCEEDRSEDPNVLPFEPQEVGIPSIGDQVTSSQREDIQSLLQEHSAVFDTSPGHTEVVEHRIKTGDGKPVYTVYHKHGRAKFKMRCKQCWKQE